MLAVVGAVAPVAAAARVPKVVLVVGPVGSLTNEYRSLANAAAVEALADGAEVTKVYSPNATWPAVRKALNGASIVVYLGHGNGWPSPYRDSLYPPTQNGFGLNPVAGADDVNHQYFGEASVDNIKLAPNAVVLLSHLCYASGNSEPGLPEGSESQAIQRVDNYAAGFIRAGAQAVVAEAHMGPAYYVRSLLRSQLSIEQIWRGSPSANGNTLNFASERSPGFAERLDPDHANSSFYRSLVSRGVSSTQLAVGCHGDHERHDAVVDHPAAGRAVAHLARADVRPGQHPVAADRLGQQPARPAGRRGRRETHPDGNPGGHPLGSDHPRRAATAADPARARSIPVAVRFAVRVAGSVGLAVGRPVGLAVRLALPVSVGRAHRPARRRPRRPRAAGLGRDAQPGRPQRQGPERRRHVPVGARPVPPRRHAP